MVERTIQHGACPIGNSVINPVAKGLRIDVVLKPLLREAMLIGNLLKLLIQAVSYFVRIKRRNMKTPKV